MSTANPQMGKTARYRPERLPSPRDFYAGIFGGGTRKFRPSQKEWTQVSCCFHGRDRRPSLSLNLQSGGFHCFSCGAKGGSIIDFVMLRDRCDFKQAAQHLGAWNYNDCDHAARAEYERRGRERKWKLDRIELAADSLSQCERALRLEYRDRIHECDHVLAASGPWSEAQWRRAQAAYTLQDYLLSAYTILCWGALHERTRYVLHVQERDEITAAVRVAGGIRTENGGWMGVPA